MHLRDRTPMPGSGLLPPPAPLPSLSVAFSRRRAIFGPHELREDRIRAASYLADDLSAEARRALREGEVSA